MYGQVHWQSYWELINDIVHVHHEKKYTNFIGSAYLSKMYLVELKNITHLYELSLCSQAKEQAGMWLTRFNSH